MYIHIHVCVCALEWVCKSFWYGQHESIVVQTQYNKQPLVHEGQDKKRIRHCTIVGSVQDAQTKAKHKVTILTYRFMCRSYALTLARTLWLFRTATSICELFLTALNSRLNGPVLRFVPAAPSSGISAMMNVQSSLSMIVLVAPWVVSLCNINNGVGCRSWFVLLLDATTVCRPCRFWLVLYVFRSILSVWYILRMAACLSRTKCM